MTSYDNATGRVRWRLATGPVPQAWRTDGGKLYMAESAGGFLGSAPVTALRQINLATGAQILVRPLEGLSFTGTFSAAFAGVVLFSTAGGVTATTARPEPGCGPSAGRCPRVPTRGNSGST